MRATRQQIADAQNERNKLLGECILLLKQVSESPYYLKLLVLAREHLKMLAAYKGSRELHH